ncbi:hypothetical protein PVAND_001462 [Polypedilum vanderplanki]|uniref:Secreted protein n=1 Tax=Polypedilum vanderplanki TaxID=319348 RepID=A0A9J6BPA8_POLVA|nr:hypothetical protein PVAND_001462 [Polypedilum vanderplanki]
MKSKFCLVFLALIFIFSSSSGMSLNSFLMKPIAAITENHKILPNIQEHKAIHPDFIQILIRKFKNDDNIDEIFNNNDEESKQIPVISDIERIKKFIEIIEFVGDKVGDLIDKITEPPTQTNQEPYDYRNSETSEINSSSVEVEKLDEQ